MGCTELYLSRLPTVHLSSLQRSYPWRSHQEDPRSTIDQYLPLSQPRVCVWNCEETGLTRGAPSPQSTGSHNHPFFGGGKPMQVSHITDVVQTPALCRLAHYIRQHGEQWQAGDEAPDLERFEQELHAHIMAFEREMIAEELCRYDVSAEEVIVDGIPSQRSLASSETYVSAAGPVTVTRHLYRPAGRSTKS